MNPRHTLQELEGGLKSSRDQPGAERHWRKRYFRQRSQRMQKSKSAEEPRSSLVKESCYLNVIQEICWEGEIQDSGCLCQDQKRQLQTEYRASIGFLRDGGFSV